MKKILIVGQTLELGRTEEVYGRGFLALDWEVEYFTWQEALPSLLSISLLDKALWRLAWQPLAKLANQKLVEVVTQFRPDLTLVISPLLLHPDSLQAIKQHSLAFVFFTDNPLDVHHTHSNAWIKGCFSLWDAAFIWSQELVESLRKNGFKKALFHPFCCDIAYHFPQRQPSSPLYDVAFIGNWDASRKREQYLKAISHYRLGLWGSNYWNTHCQETSLKGLCQGMCSYEEIPKVLALAKMGLNILRPQNELGHNIRTYEIPATRTLTLSERSPMLPNLFAEDKEAVYFSTPEELSQKVAYLLQNPSLIESIAEAGYKNAIQNTVIDRVREISDLYHAIKFDRQRQSPVDPDLSREKTSKSLNLL